MQLLLASGLCFFAALLFYHVNRIGLFVLSLTASSVMFGLVVYFLFSPLSS